MDIHQQREDKLKKSVEEISQIFQSKPQFYLSIFKYSITHGMLEFVIYENDFFKRTRVSCGGCYYISGNTHGGPYNLEIAYESIPSDSSDLPGIVIAGNQSELCIKCSRVSLLSPWAEPENTPLLKISPNLQKTISAFDQKAKELDSNHNHAQAT